MDAMQRSRLHVISVLSALFLLLTAALLPAQQAYADELIMKDGSRLIGEVVKRENGTLEFKTSYAGVINISWDEVAELHADEPPLLAGGDVGANPVEHLLNALAACVTTSMVAHAAVRGIRIDELESELEGDIDLRGFLGLSNDVPKGFTDIRINFKVKSDVNNMARLKRLTEYSPVFNTITQGANVDIQEQSK